MIKKLCNRSLLIALLLTAFCSSVILPGEYANEKSKRLLVWASSGAVHTLNLSTLEYEILDIPIVHSPNSIEIDEDNRKLYWASENEGLIFSSNIDGSEHQQIVGGLQTIRDLVLDNFAHRLYWVEIVDNSAKGFIRYLDLLEGSIHTLQLSSSSRPRYIDIESQIDRLFWVSDSGEFLYSAKLDGSNQVMILNHPFISQFQLDEEASQIYWRSSNEIWRSDLDGTNIELLHQSGLDERIIDFTFDEADRRLHWIGGCQIDCGHKLINLKVDEDQDPKVIYHDPIMRFADIDVLKNTGDLIVSGSKRIQKFNFATLKLEEIVSGIDEISAISAGSDPNVIYIGNSRELQKLDLSTIQVMKIGVQSDNIKDMVLDQITGEVYYTLPFDPYVSYLRNDLEEVSKISILDPSEVHALGGISVTEDRLYAAINESIFSASKSGTDVREIVGELPSIPQTLVGRRVQVDSASGKIYWTDLLRGSLQMANLDGTSAEMLYTGANVWGLALDLEDRKIYWSTSGGTSEATILRSNLDGSNIEEIHRGDLAIDLVIVSEEY